MSSNDKLDQIRTVSEDRSRNWANNVLEKSAGGRVKNDEPKMNWLVIIFVFVLIIIAIIYFSYNSEAKTETPTETPAIEAVTNPALSEPSIPALQS